MEAPPTEPASLAAAAAEPRALTAAGRGARLRRFGELRRSPAFLVGAVVLAFWVLDALAWRLVVPYDPLDGDILARLEGPSSAHWLGTDDLGRDVLSRVLAGAATVLTVAPLATALGIAGGVALGLVTGYYRGLVDDVVGRLIDAVLALPLIMIAVLVLAVLGRSTLNVILVIGIVFMPLVARTVRSAVLVEREREYVAAARLRGEHGAYIMVSEILPNVWGPVVVESTVRLGYAIFTAATLSFLGLGLQPPSPDWGLSIAEGRTYLEIAPWIALVPAVALATLVVAVNLVADALRGLEDA
jgi:peptide/nickel transport system permease protein